MIFTTSNRVAKKTDPVVNYIESPIATFSHQYRRFVTQKMATQPPSEPVAEKNIEEPKVEKGKKKPMKWGQPTWFLFHTLAEKVKDEYFADIRVELLNIIYTICCNLPCPDCAKHATEYMNSINFNTIQTKQDLQLMLFNFHNEVNRRKKFPEFSIEKLNATYSLANTVNIIHNFMPYFEDRTGSMRLIADNLHRSRVALQLKAWFNKNITYFNL
jgi:hypothetical protein